MEFKLPELGEGVHEGELVKWKIKVGDTVKDDQILCEIMTDKATMEIPSAFHGKVVNLNAKEGETVKVGQVMAARLPHRPPDGEWCCPRQSIRGTGRGTPPRVVAPAGPRARAGRRRCPT